MTQVYVSRFMPGLKNGRNVDFRLSEVVQIKRKSGELLDITIDSVLMKNHWTGQLGYEVIASDDNKRYFAESEQIIDWEGKAP